MLASTVLLACSATSAPEERVDDESVSALQPVPAGTRRKVNDLPPAERRALADAILRYVTRPVLDEHANAHDWHHPQIGELFFVRHHEYLGRLESWLATNGFARFTPFPMWDPADPIPPELLAVSPLVPQPHTMNANPNRPLPTRFANLCSYASASDLARDMERWHDGVHGAVSGPMGSLSDAPGTAIFWLWHGFLDDQFHRYEACRVPPPPPPLAPNVCRPAPTPRNAPPARNDVALLWQEGALASFTVYDSTGSSFASPLDFNRRDGGWGDDVKWASGDFTGDGRADVLAVWNNGGQNVLSVRASNGATFASSHWGVNFGGWMPTTQWLPGDFDGDGKLDVVAAWNSGGKAAFAFYKGTGSSFNYQVQWGVEGGWMDDAKWTVGDFDNDGKADLATAWNDGGNVTLTVRRSTGSSFVPAHWATKQGGWMQSTAYLAGDFDGDGDTDIAAVWNHGGKAAIAVYPNDAGRGFLYHRQWIDGDGGFADDVKWSAADFDGDGKTDIVAGWNDGGRTRLTVRRSTGTTFQHTHWTPAGSGLTFANNTQLCVGSFR